MISTTLARRARRQGAAAIALLVAFGVGTAHADITGTVTTPQRAGVGGVTVEVVGPGGVAVPNVADNTDGLGNFVIATAVLAAAGPGPYTLATSTETCRKDDGGTPAVSAPVAPVADGAVVALTLDTQFYCAALEPDPPVTGHYWAERNRFLARPGGTLAIDALVPFEAADLRVVTAQGSVLGAGPSRLGLRFGAPGSPFTGAITLNWTEAGAPVARPIGTLAVAKPAKPRPPRGAVDLALIMQTSDRLEGPGKASQRSAALAGLIGEATGGDRILATSFADGATTIFPRSTVSGASSRARLVRLARKRAVATGDRDYDDGLAAAFAALSAKPQRASRPKAAVFIADADHDYGVYDNTHLRFAFNGTARAWPICVVQVGGELTSAGTALLRRIASDTTGRYRRVSGVGGLANAVEACDP